MLPLSSLIRGEYRLCQRARILKHRRLLNRPIILRLARWDVLLSNETRRSPNPPLSNRNYTDLIAVSKFRNQAETIPNSQFLQQIHPPYPIIETQSVSCLKLQKNHPHPLPCAPNSQVAMLVPKNNVPALQYQKQAESLEN